MAQVLKEDQRQRIIEAAKKELLRSGYRDASMRKIAASAHMTVGNLYRYFENKDRLIETIVTPTLNQVDAILQQKTQERISLYRTSMALGLNMDDIYRVMDSLADDLMDVFLQHQDEMRILMLHSEIGNKQIEWFTQLIIVLVSEMFPQYRGEQTEVYFLSRMLAVSIINGFQECFRLSQKEEAKTVNLKRIVRMYFRCFVQMLTVDVGVMRED